MTGISHSDSRPHTITRPLPEDAKRHITTLAAKLAEHALPLDLEFDVTEAGVEFASIHNEFGCFSVYVDQQFVCIEHNRNMIADWSDFETFAKEAEGVVMNASRQVEDVLLMLWRQALSH
jgi:hypothetical protein